MLCEHVCDHTTLKMALIASAFPALPINPGVSVTGPHPAGPHPVAPISTFMAPYNIQGSGVEGLLSQNRVYTGLRPAKGTDLGLGVRGYNPICVSYYCFLNCSSTVFTNTSS